eukprot:6157306-Amphidinium_carterae.2
MATATIALCRGHRAQQFLHLRTIMQTIWNSDNSRGSTTRLEDITRYEFDEVHQWISNYFNSTYTGTNEDNKGTIGEVNNYEDENYNDENYEEYDENWEYDNDDKVTIAFMKGEAK